MVESDSRCSASRFVSEMEGQSAALSCGQVEERGGRPGRPWRWRKRRAYVASQDQVVYDAHDPPHRVGDLEFGVARVGEVNAAAIAQQTSGKKLVVYVQRSCAQVVGIDHDAGVVVGGGVGPVVITPPSNSPRGRKGCLGSS